MNKIAVITGAKGNLGSALVDQFLKIGYTVAGFSRTPTNRNDQNYNEFKADLLDEEDVQKRVLDVVGNFEKIDTAVLNVGGFAMGNIESTDVKLMRQQYQLNFETAYNSARPILKQMKTQGFGRIFFISSVAGVNPKSSKNWMAYGLSKSLLLSLADIINADVDTNKIKAFVVVPQKIALRNDETDEKQQRPEDIAALIGNVAERTSVKETPSVLIVKEELKNIK